MATVTVRVPIPLRDFVEGREAVRLEADTLEEALDRLAGGNRVLHDHLFGDDGRLRPHVNLFLEGRDVRDLAPDHRLEGEVELRIVPSIRGGAPSTADAQHPLTPASGRAGPEGGPVNGTRADPPAARDARAADPSVAPSGRTGRAPPARIVSLLASATEILCELELEERLVGISHECDHPPRVLDRPRVSAPRFDPAELDSRGLDRAVRQAMADHGNVYRIDGELLASLRPDLVLTQAVCEVCAVPTSGVREEVAARGLETRVLSLDAHTLEEILESVLAVGRATGVGARAASVRERLGARIAAVERAVEGAERPSVLALEWLDPPFAPGHWVPEMVRRAGGRNLLGEAGERSREVAWEALEGLDPDALVVMPCGYGLEAARADADRAADRLRTVAPRAVEEGRAWVVDASSYFNRSGPRVVRGIEILGGLLHPDRLPAPDPATARGWRPPAGS